MAATTPITMPAIPPPDSPELSDFVWLPPVGTMVLDAVGVCVGEVSVDWVVEDVDSLVEAV